MSLRTAWMNSLAVAGAALASGTALAADTTSSSNAGLTGQWQHHEQTFAYHGFTSFYTCDGLEDKVREILTYFGARKGVKVRATGCPGSPNTPTPTAWVKVEFDSLAASATSNAAAATAEPVAARWQNIELSANRPFFMGSGECELIDQLKPVLTASFALEDLDYRTSCVPHQISINDFSVRGRVLAPAIKS